MTEVTVSQALQQGITAHKEGNLQEAERLYRSILSVQPQHPDANHNLGVVAVAVGKVEAALPLFKTALEINPEIEQFWVSYLGCLESSGNYVLSKELIEKIKGLSFKGDAFNRLRLRLTDQQNFQADNLKDNIHKLISLFKQENIKGALEFGSSLLSQYPDHLIILNVLGASSFRSKNYKSSLRFYRKAITIKPDYADSYNNLGNVYLEFGRMQETVSYLKKALLIKRIYPQARKSLANAYKLNNKILSDRTVLLEALTFSPGNYEIYRELGRLMLKEKIPSSAFSNLKKASMLAPEDAETYYLLANTFDTHDDLESAELFYSKALKLDQKSPHFYNNLAAALQKRGLKTKDSLRLFKKAMLVSPRYINSYINLGSVLANLNNHKESVRVLKRAVQISVASAEAFNLLGVSIRDFGRKNEALNYFKKSIMLYPLQSAVYNNYGVGLALVGKNETAANMFEKAVKLQPDLAEAYFNLGEVFKEKKENQHAVEHYKSGLILKPCEERFLTVLGQLVDLEKRSKDAHLYYKWATTLSESITMSNVLLGRNQRKNGELSAKQLSVFSGYSSPTGPLYMVKSLFLPVDPDLVNALYSLPNLDPSNEQETLSHKHSSGIRTGNMVVSTDYFFLDKPNPAIQKLKRQISKILSSFVGRPIFISESFFNIYKSGSDAHPHHHLHNSDFDLGLVDQKFSMVYYVRSGDSLATKPGVLTLYDPDYSITPKDGDVIIFPASKRHSASYDGSSDRIIVGINFYQT